MGIVFLFNAWFHLAGARAEKRTTRLCAASAHRARAPGRVTEWQGLRGTVRGGKGRRFV